MKRTLLCCLMGLALATQVRSAEKKETPSMNDAKNEVAVMKTSEGEMVFELWPDVAPKTLKISKNSRAPVFIMGPHSPHRENFMVQGGDPLTKIIKESRYGRRSWTKSSGIQRRSHERGVLSMARRLIPIRGQPVFICLATSRARSSIHDFGKLIKATTADKIGRYADDHGRRWCAK